MIDFLISWWNLQVQQLQLVIDYWHIIIGALTLLSGIFILYLKNRRNSNE